MLELILVSVPFYALYWKILQLTFFLSGIFIVSLLSIIILTVWTGIIVFCEYLIFENAKYGELVDSRYDSNVTGIFVWMEVILYIVLMIFIFNKSWGVSVLLNRFSASQLGLYSSIVICVIHLVTVLILNQDNINNHFEKKREKKKAEQKKRNKELEKEKKEQEIKKQQEAENKRIASMTEEERQAEIEEKRRLEQQALDEKRKRAKQAEVERKKRAWEENRKFFVQSQWQDFCFYFELGFFSIDYGMVKLRIINSNGEELLFNISEKSFKNNPFEGQALVEIRVAISKLFASLAERGFTYSNTVIDSIVAGIRKNLDYHVEKEFIFRNETKSRSEVYGIPNIEQPLSLPEKRDGDTDFYSLQNCESGSSEVLATPKMMNKNNENNLGLQSILAELDGMIGLDRVKEEIHTIVNQVRVNQMKRAAGIKTDMGSMHLVFSGNPGTGKTTVARIVGRIYTELGVLKKGTFLEVSRSKLCAEYLGQTAIKTEAVVKSAIGGVLFIDEAYSLYQSNQDDYGKEAIDTLLKLMEDQRKNLVVIVAGYTNLIQTFLSSNPGLESRFTTTIHFEDYNASDMYRIFEAFCKKDGYAPSPGASTILKEYFQDLYDARSDNFANAREVRNAYEKALKNQSNRLAKISHSPSRRELLTLDEEDVSRLK